MARAGKRISRLQGTPQRAAERAIVLQLIRSIREYFAAHSARTVRTTRCADSAQPGTVLYSEDCTLQVQAKVQAGPASLGGAAWKLRRTVRQVPSCSLFAGNASPFPHTRYMGSSKVMQAHVQP